MFCVEVTAIRDPSHVFIAPVVSHAFPPSEYQQLLTAHWRNYQDFIHYVNSSIEEFPIVDNLKIGKYKYFR